ncbi:MULTISPECIES: ATP/GTP-binding protein [Arthrobacter]|uniref:ATP/GTP-binding protein n=1 Tax=unclassified Arthrobacter TaxID=235627 RepID=UPI0024BA88EE|nr:ATP/GTP-binding protein [Arthrobacter sp. H35-MC1]MDJ0316369.1 ATP/GTP-binding protein [Arthrobacter sp. H35-MC1]
MPRSNQPRRRRTSSRRSTNPALSPNEEEEFDLNRVRMGIPATETAPDGVWAVRAISVGNAQKAYTCPGCHHQVLPGVAHLVVWQEDAMFGAEAGLRDRRHWHTNCWRGRSYRYR